MTDRKLSIQALVDSLHEKFPDKGFLLNDTLAFGPTTAHGIGVTTTANLSKDDILMVIPDSQLLNINNIGKGKDQAALVVNNAVKQIQQKCKIMNDEGDMLQEAENMGLVVAIMAILAQGGESPWAHHAVTWPSEDYMKLSCFVYWDPSQWNTILKEKTYMHMRLKAGQVYMQRVYDEAIKPLLSSKKGETASQQFIMKSKQDLPQDQGLKETFWYAFSIVWSRCHEGLEGPELIPLGDLFNGMEDIHCSEQINVDLARGYWPFVRGRMYDNRFNLKCSCFYANRDIVAGTELILSYGSISPSSFFLKYGCVPRCLTAHPKMVDNVIIYLNPDLVPPKNDALRWRCMLKHYPNLTQLASGEYHWTVLTPEELEMFRCGQESQPLAALRQMIILGNLATDPEVQVNIDTGRIRVANASGCGSLMLRLIDYNLQLVDPEHDPDEPFSSVRDIEQSKSSETAPFEEAMLLARACQRETLLLWRSAMCQRYGMEYESSVCRVCGRSYPSLKCGRCKWKGDKAAMYCSKEHQKSDWKHHKYRCQEKPLLD